MALDKDCVKMMKRGGIDVPVYVPKVKIKLYEEDKEFEATEGREELREPKLKGGKGE